jgi:uncharacterized hydrophobic protein (TIGR00271 family)
MALLFAPRPFTEESRRRAVSEVLDATIPDRDFYLLLLGAIAFAICAIFTDSIALLIASMIVAPLGSPILGLGLGIAVFDLRLIARCLGMVILSLVAAVGLAFAATYTFGHIRVDPTFISFDGNLYIATLVAVLAGAIAAYGFVRVKVGGAMTGIGIAVSLLPPLVATGIAIADTDIAAATHAFLIFLLNLAGIAVASALVFGMFKLGAAYRASKHNS